MFDVISPFFSTVYVNRQIDCLHTLMNLNLVPSKYIESSNITHKSFLKKEVKYSLWKSVIK